MSREPSWPPGTAPPPGASLFPARRPAAQSSPHKTQAPKATARPVLSRDGHRTVAAVSAEHRGRRAVDRRHPARGVGVAHHDHRLAVRLDLELEASRRLLPGDEPPGGIGGGLAEPLDHDRPRFSETRLPGERRRLDSARSGANVSRHGAQGSRVQQRVAIDRRRGEPGGLDDGLEPQSGVVDRPEAEHVGHTRAPEPFGDLLEGPAARYAVGRPTRMLK